jgi:hypothetical protein
VLKYVRITDKKWLGSKTNRERIPAPVRKVVLLLFVELNAMRWTRIEADSTRYILTNSSYLKPSVPVPRRGLEPVGCTSNRSPVLRTMVQGDLD